MRINVFISFNSWRLVVVVLMRLLALLVYCLAILTLNPSDILSFAKQIAAAMVGDRESYLHVHVHIVAFTPSLPPSL